MSDLLGLVISMLGVTLLFLIFFMVLGSFWFLTEPLDPGEGEQPCDFCEEGLIDIDENHSCKCDRCGRTPGEGS